MKKRKVFFIAAILLAGVILGGFAARAFLGKPSFTRLRGGKDFNVILITLDTTRADRIGCYGFPNVETPTLDLLASRGVRFERCYAQTPLTLPSHTSIMTGTLPIFHGIRDNGGFLVPQKMETMAELFKAKGYETGAFIAAYGLYAKAR